MLNNFFNSGPFMPHGHCYLWTPGLVALQAISDGLITLAYYSIPFTLVYFVRRRKDLKFRKMFLLFAVFILACGTTHLMEVWNIWHGNYWLSGLIKAFTAVASISTAIQLVRLVPFALALPSPDALEKAYGELEIRVQARTAELVKTANDLKIEVAERKRAQMDAVRLAAIVDSSDDAIIGKNLESIITSWNHAATRIFGYTEAEMLGESIMRLIPEDRLQEESQILTKIRQGKIVDHFETFRRTKDGRLIEVSVTSSPIKDGDGHIVGVSKIARDITQERNAEKSKLESMRFAQATIDALPAHICVLNESGQIIATNSAWRRYPESNSFSGRGTQVGANYLAVCEAVRGKDQDQAEIFAAGIRAVLGGAKPIFEMEYPCHTPAEDRWFVGRVTRFPGEGELRVVVAHENITARKQAYDESNKLRQLVEHSPDFIALADMDGKLTFMNAGGRRMIGLEDSEDITGVNFRDYIPEPWQVFFQETVVGTAMKNGIWRGEMQLRHLKTGALIDVARTTFVINDESSKRRFFATVTQDITERKRAEIELRAKTTFLEAQVNSSPDAIIVVDSHQQRVLQNQRLLDLFNIPSEMAQGQDMSNLVRHSLQLFKNPEAVMARVQWLYDHTEEIGLDEIELMDGRILDRSSSPIRDAEGKYYGRIWCFRDITERKKATLDIETQLKELQRWHEAMLNREDRILGLKREVNELLTRLQMPARYHSPGNS